MAEGVTTAGPLPADVLARTALEVAVRSPDRLRRGGPRGGSPAIRLTGPVWARVEVQELLAVHDKPRPIREVDEDGAVWAGSAGNANADVGAGAGGIAVGLSFEVGSEGRSWRVGERRVLLRSFDRKRTSMLL